MGGFRRFGCQDFIGLGRRVMECRILQTETSFDSFQTGSGCWPVKNLHELQSKLLKGGYIGLYRD